MMNESQLKHRDNKVAASLGFVAIKIPAHHGEPDTLYYKGSVCCFVERKVSGKKLRVEQLEAQSRILLAGGYAYGIDDENHTQIVKALSEVIRGVFPKFAYETYYKHLPIYAKTYLKTQVLLTTHQTRLYFLNLVTVGGKPSELTDKLRGILPYIS